MGRGHQQMWESRKNDPGACGQAQAGHCGSGAVPLPACSCLSGLCSANYSANHYLVTQSSLTALFSSLSLMAQEHFEEQ